MTPAGPSGVLLVDKPEGPSSMAVCRRVRWLLVRGGAPKRVKVGHGGTLDPLASGVLVIMVGPATRLCESVMQGAKQYVTDIDLSQFSSTDDREGERTVVEVARPPSLEAIRGACDMLTGVIQQRPPAFSAIKVEGRRAYDLARAGAAPELAARPVVVHGIAIDAYAWPMLRLTIDCGKGTYIRSIARDLGLRLGTGGMLASLRRTRSGRVSLERAMPLAALPEPLTQTHLLDPREISGPAG